MSKITVLIAAASAAAGATCTALFMANKSSSNAYSAPLPAGASSPSVKSSPQLQNPVNPAGLFQYGFPGPVNDLATRAGLVSSYDRRTRNPIWVAEHITAESLKMKGGDRKGSSFVEDTASTFDHILMGGEVQGEYSQPSRWGERIRLTFCLTLSSREVPRKAR